MASSKMNIPKKINVGYTKREDTYTGKLAYVVYTDEKGKLRKENSWTGWCDKDIPKEEFTNEPMEGFVLNRGVGGQRASYGWNARNEYIRVYDPRDFEFEISVANLLFILQECSSIKGKGLEGKFVYSWDGAELVLLPCVSKEYEECVKFSDNKYSKVTGKDVVEGCTYQTKNMGNVMYLGRHAWFSKEHDYKRGGKHYYLKPCGKKHIFIDLISLEQKSNFGYLVESGYTKLAHRTSDEAIPEYADEYEKLVNSIHCVPPTKFDFKKTKIEEGISFYYGAHYFIKDGENYYPTTIKENRRSSYRQSYNMDQYIIAKSKTPIVISESKIKNASIRFDFVGVDEYNDTPHGIYHDKEVQSVKSLKMLQEMDFYKAVMKNEKGASFNLH